MQTPNSDLSFTVLKTICGYIRPCAPEDRHNGARNMLNQRLVNESQLLNQVGRTNHFILRMHGHTYIKIGGLMSDQHEVY